MLGRWKSVVGTRPAVLNFCYAIAVLAAGFSLTSCAVTGKNSTPATNPAISVTPSSVSFGNVKIDSVASKTVKLTNTGTASLKISQATLTGSNFTVSGLATPSTVAVGASVSFTIAYKPTATGSASGSVSIANDASETPVRITMVGTGISPTSSSTPAPEIGVTPSSVNFGNVAVNTDASQTMKLSNTGTAPLSISQVKTAGSGFSISGLVAPATVAAGSNVTFTVAFKPTAAGADSGSVSITSNAGGSPLTIDLAGAGATSTVKLAASVASVGFGNVTVGKTVTQQVQLANTGNVQVDISSASAAGAGFSASGGTNVNLAPGQSVNVTVSFDPKSTGSLSGTLTVSSNAAALKIPLTGTGTQQPSTSQHSVSLTWSPSTSSDVVGYFVYRRTGSTGGFSKLQGTVDSSTSFTDSNVADGQTYFYVVTAVAAGDLESAFSSQVEVTIPST